MEEAKIVEFAQRQGYDTVEKLKSWNGYEVYKPIYAGNDTDIVGQSYLILVKGNTIRLSTADEAIRHEERS